MHAVFQVRLSEKTNYDFHQKFRFENKYLSIVQSAINDWIVYYQPARRAGEPLVRPSGYFAKARVVSVQPAPGELEFSEAILEEYREFPTVPFSIFDPQSGSKFYYEERMLQPDGRLNSHIIQQRVRILSEDEYVRLMEASFEGLSEEEEFAIVSTPTSGFAESPSQELERSRVPHTRTYRDREFRKRVGDAYEWRCAMTGISLIAPDGSHEIECAHIKPVWDAGPDDVNNGIALLRTVHWLFDTGSVSVGPDYRIIRSARYEESIRSSDLKVREIDGLMNQSGKLLLPKNESQHPHPDFLRYHREKIVDR
jgi:putative restriction endonuclease